MHQLLLDIFETKQVRAKDGSFLPLHSNTALGQCEFLQELINETRPDSSLEVGLAYGVPPLRSSKQSARTAKNFIIELSIRFSRIGRTSAC